MASLDRLLGLIDFRSHVDQLWLVGDLVNRGPRSLDVLRWARDLGGNVTCVLGNHDLHLLARAAGATGAKRLDTLDEILDPPDSDRLIDWLRHRPLIHVDKTHVVVHAGLHPRWTVADAQARAAEIERELRGPSWRAFLTQIRARPLRADGRVEPDFDGRPADAPTGCIPWFAFKNPAWATHTVLFGHWAAL